ncbi:LLM class flavin-dependent oxidoreductase [Actinomadura barringtoniae]|uniref:LLM class flavin-dependent oxidoreductase n=1 Tax=Actinomadura barringtoniae TaxID=1427535 RepID=A0A939T660_9ACTN|nr:LLM class flavin-dependent oxidoreductase [Actinomadura barringtoniae]MBO2454551.1 LLM class flavin-dependent oxidoreductase [Actinomadura barringtoniae]
MNLPSFGVDESAGIADHARAAEQAGLESIWVGDHLIPVKPFLDSTLVLSTAAAVTHRVKLGFGVMVLPLRPVAWAAKQVATLQHLSGDRVLLGVGSGGPVHGEAAWRAVGVPFAERGARTDAALEVLPDLIAGKPSRIGDEEITLSPGATVPPVLIGGGGGGAVMRRAAQYGDEWYPAFSAPELIAEWSARVAELAAGYGRPAPRLTVGVSVGLGELPAPLIDAQVRGLTEYGLGEEEARATLILGSPSQAAERFAELSAAGAHRIIAMPFGPDRLRQTELLGETARLVAA